jgi:hypothetical protein
MFSITSDFNLDDLDKFIDGKVNNWIEGIGDKMFEAGKQVVDRARAQTKSEGGFGNITWNLRSSIGCVLVHNHDIADEHVYFPEIGQGDEGHKTGIAWARELALLMDDGDTFLIFVAGMEYAKILEDNDIDVISGSWDKFDKQFKALL